MVGARFLCVVFAIGFAVAGSLSAADAPADSKESKPAKPGVAKPSAPAAPAVPLSRLRLERRRKWERVLQDPAELTFGDQTSITLGALLEQIHKKHGLNVQIDISHVLPLATALEPVAKKVGRIHTASLSSLFPFLNRRREVPTAIPTYGPPEGGAALITYYQPPAADALLPVFEAVTADDDKSPPASDTSNEVSDKENTHEPGDKKDSENDKHDPSQSDDKSNGKKDKEDDDESLKGYGHQIAEAMKGMLETPIDAVVISQPDASVEDILRHAFDRAFPMQAMLNVAISEEMPTLASFTQATEWDLLVQDQGVLVTTRLNANLQKETRVYSTRSLEQSSKLKSEEVARVVTRTIRPWSWKKHFPEAIVETPTAAPGKGKGKATGTKKVSIPKASFDMLGLLMSSRSAGREFVRLTSDHESSSDSEVSTSSSENIDLTEEQLELMGRAWDGLFQWGVISLQVIYHADPPTGVVEVLPGMLIISQSQGAHREIADLLEQLAHPEN